MRRYLVVAHDTATSAALLDKIRECVAAGESEFHLVVPAKHPHGAWSEGQINAAARKRLDEALAEYEALGAKATGEVGDASPVRAVGDALIAGSYDEIILSTLPAGPSRWLHQDVPSRLAKSCPVPVTHVVASAVPASH